LSPTEYLDAIDGGGLYLVARCSKLDAWSPAANGHVQSRTGSHSWAAASILSK
jgi:hypothetical protein